ncbi:MAG: 1-deoxy-D-xylulose-5-phosphate synthase [Sphaerochaeta sp.]|jgi:transketolase|nr:1-deoxy-D-xylulose-5-phosphate synthase [Sphaerochaeta sp.]MCH3920586.1 1-deoxy-D-xylulose-5-phosphate synthase [Sphaerochaeta sp.]MCI2045688.1 1-deoxy-D-xylulose-5-phosphate synthase [Sphaerochaeta sp.]MCI2096623.1 1-deoxy-D-xylulose-5-phosphate synthase [Sphaerochaeta sp.]MCI2103568.1 1-deoxy-D-xylulose-5-phosphate synthase [Sphaerochaeta sp.]
MRDTKDIPFMRDALMASVNDLAAEHKEIVFLDADLSSCIGSTSFQKLYPDRFYNCGIAEANMVAVAAGLSSMGLVPFVHSFGCFASRRAFDQFYISVGYAHQVIHLIGSDPGVLAQYNGGTHMPFEDIGLMRQVPGVIIIDPSDKQSMYELTRQVYESGKISYTRSGRKTNTYRYPVGTTEIKLGKGIVLSEGEDLGIFATGEVMVNAATEAVKLLAEKGIKATLVDLHTIRPLDTDLVSKVAAKTGRILVCENGRYPGGVGEEIAAYLAKTNPVKMDFVNVGEEFGEVGTLSYLTGRFGFTAPHIAEVAEALAKR